MHYFKEFTYSTDAALQADVTAWIKSINSVSGAKTIRGYQMVALTSTKVLIMAYTGTV